MGIQSFTGLLSALCLTEADFDRFFPDLGYLKHAKRYSVKFMQEICGILKNSSAYRDYLLQIAAQRRSAVIAYLQQEITFKESFAFIEYWGRGYTPVSYTHLDVYKRQVIMPRCKYRSFTALCIHHHTSKLNDRKQLIIFGTTHLSIKDRPAIAKLHSCTNEHQEW